VGEKSAVSLSLMTEMLSGEEEERTGEEKGEIKVTRGWWTNVTCMHIPVTVYRSGVQDFLYLV